jgi:hypothetical protein
VPLARRSLVLLLGGIALALLAGRALADLRVDQLWYAAMGAGPVWREKLIDLAVLRGSGFLVGGAFAFANLYAVRRSIVAVAVPTRLGNLEIPAVVPPRRLVWFCVVGAVLLGAALAAPLTGWHRIALARHGLPFNEGETVFERDFGFYVYWLPIENAAYLWVLLTITAVGLLVFFLYALTRSLRLEGRRFRATTHVRRHLSVLAALVLLLLAWSYRLDAYDLFLAGSGPGGAFVSADRLVAQPADLGLAFGAMVAAMVVLRTGWVGQVRFALVTISVMLLAAVLARQVAPALASRGQAGPDPLREERAYLDARAAYTRRAFAVDAVTRRVDPTRPLGTPTGDLPSAVGLWDDGRLREWLTRTERDRRMVSAFGHDAGERDGSRVVRTIAVQQPAAGAAVRRWTVSSFDAGGGDERGAPRREIVAIEAPLVHEGAAGVVLVDDTSQAVGSPLDGWLSRLAHAWSLQQPSLLFERPDGDAGPRHVLLRRDVRERVEALAPVFMQGSDVRPVWHDEVLYWALDLYAASERYPLSEAVPVSDGIATYFRHAATALVEATTGRVLLVTVPSPDPIARSWQARFPSLFVSPSGLPAGLAAKLPPPLDAAVVQAGVLARHGSRARTDDEPRRLGEGAAPLGAVPLVLDGVAAFTVPLVARDESLSGLLVAMGGAERGARWVPVAGGGRWGDLLDRARRLTTPPADSASGRAGRAAAPRGTAAAARVILTEDRPLAVVPSFALDADERPTLEQVAVAGPGSAGAIGRSTAEAVARLAGTLPAGPARRAPGPDDAARLYDALRAALTRGDWPRFGATFDSLGRALRPPP